MKSLEKNKKNPKKVSEISEIIMPPEDSSPPNPKVEENNPPKKPAFFMPSNIAAKYFTNLDQCCCADVPCLSIIKEYCESRLDKIFELSSRVYIKGEENLEKKWNLWNSNNLSCKHREIQSGKIQNYFEFPHYLDLLVQELKDAIFFHFSRIERA